LSELSPRPTDALVVVDLQNDFCPAGALAVPEGDRIVPLINRLLALPVLFKAATRDWHPPGHVSFEAQGGIWPPHCVMDTPGAGFHPGLDTGGVDLIVSKGSGDAEAYSGFDGTALAADLRGKNIDRIFVCGLATDYCVRATALDGRREGFDVVVLEDVIRAVDVKPGDGDRAIREMSEAGCTLAESAAILS
jgi:nicotinamidase/pyrazinamidase